MPHATPRTLYIPVPWLAAVVLATGLVLAAGCGPKGGELSKLKVQASPDLKAAGMEVKDWTTTNKAFSVKLAAKRDFGPPLLLTVQADRGPVQSMLSPIAFKAGESKWVEFAGPKFRGRLEVTSQTKTVTIGYRDPEPLP